MDEGLYRSSVSRSYYATFSAVVAALGSTGLTPGADREAWTHATLPRLVRQHLLREIGHGRVKALRRMLTGAYKDRIIADYVTTESVDRETASRRLSNATAVIRLLEKYL